MHNEPITAPNESLVEEIRLKVVEAIVHKRAVAARYNGDLIKLAPHALFERHGDLFIRALNMSKSWRLNEERRLGQFKLSGLKAARLLDEAFDPLRSYKACAPRSDDVLIMTL